MAKILIVEDEAKIARFLELELKHEGYEVAHAADGRTGLELALEKDRWGGTLPQWERMILRLHNFTNGRSLEMIDSLCNTLHFTQQEREHYFGELLAQMK